MFCRISEDPKEDTIQMSSFLEKIKSKRPRAKKIHWSEIASLKPNLLQEAVEMLNEIPTHGNIQGEEFFLKTTSSEDVINLKTMSREYREWFEENGHEAVTCAYVRGTNHAMRERGLSAEYVLTVDHEGNFHHNTIMYCIISGFLMITSEQASPEWVKNNGATLVWND